MPVTPVSIRVQETLGEPDDPGEGNINLVLAKTSLPDGETLFAERVEIAPGYTVLTVGANVVGHDVLQEEVRGEPDDPQELNVQLVIDKGLLSGHAGDNLEGSLYTRTGRAALLVIDLPDA